MNNLSKLERFDHTLNELEMELSNLRNTSEAYARLQDLEKSYKTITQSMGESSKALEELVFQQIRKHQEIEKGLHDLEEANNKNYIKLEESYANQAKELNELVEKLRKENRSFYLDFEGTVRIKLDENKSQIKKLIEEEREKIQTIIDAGLDNVMQKVLAKQKQTQTFVIIIGIITLIAIAILLVKAFL